MPGADEELKKVTERVKELGERIGRGLEEVGKRLEKKDVPKLVRDVTTIAVGAMAIYTLGYAVSVMLPVARPVFTQLAIMLGYLIPMLFSVMVMSLTVAVVKALVK